MDLDIEKMKKEWVGLEFDSAEFTISEEDILTWAETVGESDPRFSDPAHPDFQAPPTLPARLVSRRILPQGFPRFGRRGFDGGKCVVPGAPIRAGDVLVGKSHVEDIYEKTGRSGAMYFIVHRMQFTNQRGENVSTVDWRMVQQQDRPKGSDG